MHSASVEETYRLQLLQQVAEPPMALHLQVPLLPLLGGRLAILRVPLLPEKADPERLRNLRQELRGREGRGFAAQKSRCRCL